jgi:PEGA domain-containing protein
MRLKNSLSATLALVTFLLLPASRAQAQDNKIMGQVDFQASTKPEKNAGVWVDGQYLGYVKELKGDKKVLLLPGEHEIVARQSGYEDFQQKLTVEPGKAMLVNVQLTRNPEAEYSKVTAEVKLHVEPDRAAVFVDGAFAGYVHQFGGVGRSMLVSPGKHDIKIALPGFRDFTTQVNLLPNQKFSIETKLVPASITQADPAVKQN